MFAMTRSGGAVVGTSPAGIAAALPGARVGDGARIRSAAGRSVDARVAAIANGRATLVPLGTLDGVAAGDRVDLDPLASTLVLGTPLLGRAIDAAGTPLDGRPAPRGMRRSAVAERPSPNDRTAIDRPCWTGIRAIDGLLTIGRGARVGLFGAPGCGKSTLLDAIVSGAEADATVVALIGERGREAERRLRAVGPRTTLVCATSDRSPAERLRAAEAAFAHADRLRRRGLHVLLVVDSLARVVAAARENALAAGELAGRGGYPPSVFAHLARLVEGAGAAHGGAVTLVATVLSDGGDEREPLTDAVRSLLDGHLILSERLARSGRYPAIDVLASASRTMGDVVSPAHLAAARRLRGAIALLEETAEVRRLGLEGAISGDLARARAAESEIDTFLRQGETPSGHPETLKRLVAIADSL